MDEVIRAKLEGALQELRDSAYPTMKKLEVYFQASGELPYKIDLPEEQLPEAGVLSIERVSDSVPATEGP